MGTSVGPGCGARWDPLLPGALPHVPPKVAGAGGAPRPAAPHYTRLQPLSTKPSRRTPPRAIGWEAGGPLHQPPPRCTPAFPQGAGRAQGLAAETSRGPSKLSDALPGWQPAARTSSLLQPRRHRHRCFPKTQTDPQTPSSGLCPAKLLQCREGSCRREMQREGTQTVPDARCCLQQIGRAHV